jgi:hypothetical protein
VGVTSGRFVRQYDKSVASLRFYRYLSTFGIDAGEGVERIDFSPGTPWMVLRKGMGGWRILLTGGFGEPWGNLYRSPLFVPLIDTLFRDIVARGRLSCAAFAPGGEIAMDLPGISGDIPVDLVAPDGERRQVFPDGGRLRMSGPAAPGNYLLEFRGEDIGGFSVNPDARESDLREIPADQLPAACGGLSPTVVRRGKGLDAAIFVERRGRDLWWECLFLALLLFFAEGIVANRGKK